MPNGLRGGNLGVGHRHVESPADAFLENSELARIKPLAEGFHLGELAGCIFTPLEALQTATINPAKFFGMEDRLGTVERGKLADMVLLDANPLDDIRNTQKIAGVIANGRYFSRKDLDEMLAGVERVASAK